MLSAEQISEILKILEMEYPKALCSLEYTKDYELLFAVRLAAQCSDERVNKVAPALFERFPTLSSLADADLSEIEEYIHSCGFFRSKARDIVLCARTLLERHGGSVPGTMDELLKLPGVGRKTANLILGDIYNMPAVVVDTHCIRLSNRIGFVCDLKDPFKIEMKLKECIPPEKSSDFCHRLVLHGRAVCSARKPNCDNCRIKHLCREFCEHGAGQGDVSPARGFKRKET